MAATAGNKLTFDPMGKCSNAFFSETTNTIKNQTIHECSLDDPLQTLGFCSDMKFKVAATAGLNLTLDPMAKIFKMLLL